VKPSHDVKIGEIITVNQPPVLKTLKPIGLIENRVSAKLAVEFVEDLTPKEEYDKARNVNSHSFEFRPRGIGRPTKRERRIIENLKDYLKE